MQKFAVVKTGGKQYLVKEGDSLFIERISGKVKDKVKIETFLKFDSEGKKVEIGKPSLKEMVQGEIVNQLKGDKIRVARFKAKVRYRKVRGFRKFLTEVKITKI